MAWKDGETISPLGLNRIEEAVASMNESYTPTVWRVGDSITAEKLNKIENGIANAEGVTVEALNVTENGTYSEEGKAYSPVVVDVAGDFKKATVTFNCNGGEGYSSVYGTVFAQQLNEENTEYLGACYIDENYGITTENYTKIAHNETPIAEDYYLYDDCYLIVYESHAVESGEYIITGNAEIVNDEGGAYLVKVTGNATITTAGDDK